MERTLISINTPNVITIALIAFFTWGIGAVIMQMIRQSGLIQQGG
jgi:hypothetical protein